MHLENPSCLGYGPKDYDAQAKINVFFTIDNAL